MFTSSKKWTSQLDPSCNLCSSTSPLMYISQILCLDIYNWSLDGLEGQCSLTQEVKLLGEEVKQDAGVHGEEDSEVSPQRTPHKEMVNSCPVSCVHRDLKIHTHKPL